MSSQFDYQQVLERMALVDLDVRIWSGRAKLRPEDINLGAGGELPPEQASSLGSKKVFDPTYLRPFERLKKSGERYLAEHGMSLLGAWAVPIDHLDQLTAKLDDIKRQFREAEEEFRSHYDTRFEAWVDEFHAHPDFQQQLRKAKVAQDEIPGRFHFRYSVVRIQPAAQPGDLQTQVEGLGDEMLEDVAQEAAELYRRAFAGFGGEDRHYSQRTLRPLKRIRSKLDGLLFLDSAAQVLVSAIDDVLGRLPDKGKLSPAQIVEVVSLTNLLSDRERIRDLIAQHGELITPAQREAAQWGSLTSATPAQATLPTSDPSSGSDSSGDDSSGSPIQASSPDHAAETLSHEPAVPAGDDWF